MTSWNINDGTNDFDIYDPKVVRQLAGLNYAEMSVICNETTKPIMGASATLTYGATTVFIGYVNELKKVNVGEYTLKLVEIANDLTLYYVHTGTAPSENRVVIIDNNPGAPYTLGDYIDTILNDTGWTDASDSIYRDITLNPVTSAIFDDTMFNNMTVYDALVQMIETTCGYYVWFDNALKQVHYGPKDTLVTGRTNHGDLSAYIIDTYTEDSNVNHDVDRVVVVSTVNTTDGAEYEGSYPTTGLPSYPKTLIYQYEDVVSNSQAATLAQQIYNERNATRDRFEINITPDIITINEGDLITYDEVSYSVVDVTINDDNVIVGLKYYKESIFDRLGDKIKLVSGVSTIGIDSTFDCSPQNVPTTDDTPDTVVSWTWNISDVTKIGSDVHITPHIEQYKSQSYQNTLNVNNQYLSAITPVVTSSASSGSTVINYSSTDPSPTFTYLPSSTGVRIGRSGFTNGYEFAMFSASVIILYTGASSNLAYLKFQYSHDGSTWYDCHDHSLVADFSYSQTFSYLTGWAVTSTSYYIPFNIDEDGHVTSALGPVQLLTSTGDARHRTNYTKQIYSYPFTCLIPGSSTDSPLYFRVAAFKAVNIGTMQTLGVDFVVSFKERHTHTFTQSGASDDNIIEPDQIDEVTNVGYAPTQISIKINDGGWVTIYDDTESVQNFKTYLVSGQNTISVKSESACNVGLTVNYQTFGSG